MKDKIQAQFDNHKNNENTVSLLSAEKILHSFGFNTSRKQIASLVRSGTIKGTVTTGKNSNGDRILLDLDAFIELIEYVLAESISSLYGTNSKEKSRILKFAKECSEEVDLNDESTLKIKLKSFVAAGYLVDEKLHGQRRLDVVKKMQSLVYKACVAYWFTRILLHQKEKETLTVWPKVQSLLLTKSAVAKTLINAIEEQPTENLPAPSLSIINPSSNEKEKIVIYVQIAIAYGTRNMLVTGKILDYLNANGIEICKENFARTILKLIMLFK